ncbi:MAG TPA: DUF202 domain-containing protein [Candidatus Angelobacter sp.]|jgi:putative membrane protein|nr:DUF202 domain-containing protein [Candidatus Angelobacter sp.]
MSSTNGKNDKVDTTLLALDRTWLAYERTLMAWVRTSTSMITFGFTIYKFFQFEAGRGAPATRGFFTPRDFALVMVGIGLVALLLAAVAHWKQTRSIAAQFPGRRSEAAIVALLVTVFGMLVFLSALFRQ